MEKAKTRKKRGKNGVGRPISLDPKKAVTIRLRESTIKRAEKLQKDSIRKIVEGDIEARFAK